MESTLLGAPSLSNRYEACRLCLGDEHDPIKFGRLLGERNVVYNGARTMGFYGETFNSVFGYDNERV